MAIKLFKHPDGRKKTAVEWALILGHGGPQAFRAYYNKWAIKRGKLEIAFLNKKDRRTVTKKKKHLQVERIYTNPFTNESGSKFYWSDKLHINPTVFLQRIRMHGLDSKKTWRTKDEAARDRKMSCGPRGTAEYKSLNDNDSNDGRRYNLDKIKIGTWEEKAFPEGFWRNNY